MSGGDRDDWPELNNYRWEEKMIDDTITFRLTEEEKNDIITKAEKEGQTISNIIRKQLGFSLVPLDSLINKKYSQIQNN